MLPYSRRRRVLRIARSMVVLPLHPIFLIFRLIRLREIAVAAAVTRTTITGTAQECKGNADGAAADEYDQRVKGRARYAYPARERSCIAVVAIRSTSRADVGPSSRARTDSPIQAAECPSRTHSVDAANPVSARSRYDRR